MSGFSVCSFGLVLFCLFGGFFCLCASEEHNLIVIRHGESEHNIQNVLNSNPSHPNYRVSNLTENGKKQVIATAKDLLAKGFNDSNIDVVFVSPLPRTQQTAELLAAEGLFSKDKIRIDPRIIENQAGDLEGKPSYKDYIRDAEVYHLESSEQLEKRIHDFYEMVMNKYPTGNIVVVTHQTPGLALLKLAGHSGQLNTGEAVVAPLKAEASVFEMSAN